MSHVCSAGKTVVKFTKCEWCVCVCVTASFHAEFGYSAKNSCQTVGQAYQQFYHAVIVSNFSISSSYFVFPGLAYLYDCIGYLQYRYKI